MNVKDPKILVIQKKTKTTQVIKWLGSNKSLWAHSIFFVGIFVLYFFGFSIDKILLILTTVVSLEAIYMAIFIQISVNRTNQSLEEVEADVAEIQEDVEEIQEDVGELQEDVGEIQEDVEDLGENVEEIQGDIDEITLEETEAEHQAVAANKLSSNTVLLNMEKQLQTLIREIEELKKNNK
jgi:methyl-accepting chemotaxis protein